MFVFYDRLLPHVYFAKTAVYFPFNSWISFQLLCRLLWGYHIYFVDRGAHRIFSRGVIDGGSGVARNVNWGASPPLQPSSPPLPF